LSTLDGLADLFEDEIIPTPIPMKIQLENLALHLVEDRPSKNITSPGSLPIDVAIPSLLITRDRSGLFSVQPSGIDTPAEELDDTITTQTPAKPHIALLDSSDFKTRMTDAFMSNAHASVPEVTKPITGSSSSAATSSAKLELVRSGGAASIEEELQQRASILAVDNANLRTMLDQTNSELHSLRAKMNEFDTMQQKLVKMQQQVLASDKESKGLKQTLKYLQTELVKTGKKMPLDPGPNGNSSSSLASQPLGGAAAGTTSGAAQCSSPSLNTKIPPP